MAINKIVLSDGTTELTGVKSVTYKKFVNAGQDIRPGAVSSARIEVEVFGTQSNAVQTGSKIYYYRTINNTEQLIGSFFAEPCIESRGSYRIVAYDNVKKLDADFSAWLLAHQADFPMTIEDIAIAACTVAGVPHLSFRYEEFQENIEAFYVDGISCRDILSWAAEIHCSYVYCMPNGAINFGWYSQLGSETIAPTTGTNQVAYKQNGLKYETALTAAIDGVSVHPVWADDNVVYTYPLNATGNIVHIRSNLLLNGVSQAFLENIARDIYLELAPYAEHRPMQVNLFPGECPFSGGETVTITDAQGVTFSAPITSITITNAYAKLESAGKIGFREEINVKNKLSELTLDVANIKKLNADEAWVNRIFSNDIVANGTISGVMYRTRVAASNVGYIELFQSYLKAHYYDLLNPDATIEATLRGDRLNFKYTNEGPSYDTVTESTIGPGGATYSFKTYRKENGERTGEYDENLTQITPEEGVGFSTDEDIVFNGNQSLTSLHTAKQTAPNVTISNSNDYSYINCYGNERSMWLSVDVTGAITANSWTTVATLDDDDKPKFNQAGTGFFGGEWTMVRVTTAGNVQISASVGNTQGTTKALRAQIVWFHDGIDPTPTL